MLIGFLCLLGYMVEDTNIIKYIGDSVLIECVFGIILYLINERINFNANNIIIVLLIMLLYSYMWWDCLKGMTDLRFLRLGICSLFFVFLFIGFFRDKEIPNYFVKLGDMSFSIYIIEYFTTKMFKVLTSNLMVIELKYIFLIPLLISTYFLSYLSYEIIEKRLTRWLLAVLVKDR